MRSSNFEKPQAELGVIKSTQIDQLALEQAEITKQLQKVQEMQTLMNKNPSIKIQNPKIEEQVYAKIGELTFKQERIELVKKLLLKGYDTQIKQYIDRINKANELIQHKYYHDLLKFNLYLEYLQNLRIEYHPYEKDMEDLCEFYFNHIFRKIDDDLSANSSKQKEEKATKLAPALTTTAIIMSTPANKTAEKDSKKALINHSEIDQILLETTELLETANRKQILLKGHFDEKIITYMDHIDHIADPKEKESFSSEKAQLKSYLACLQTKALDTFPKDLTEEKLKLIFADIQTRPKKTSSDYATLSQTELLTELKSQLRSLEELRATNNAIFRLPHWNEERTECWTYEDKISDFEKQVSQEKTTANNVKEIVQLTKYLTITYKNLNMQKELVDKIVNLEVTKKKGEIVRDFLLKGLDNKIKQYIDRIEQVNVGMQENLYHEKVLLDKSLDCLKNPRRYVHYGNDVIGGLWESDLYYTFQRVDKELPADAPKQKEEKTPQHAPTLVTTPVTLFAPANKTTKDDSKELFELNNLLKIHGFEIKVNPPSKQSINEEHYRIFADKSDLEQKNNFYIELLKKHGVIEPAPTLYHNSKSWFYCIRMEKLPREKILALTQLISFTELTTESLPSQQPQHKLTQ